jgi:hypothetical protein
MLLGLRRNMHGRKNMCKKTRNRAGWGGGRGDDSVSKHDESTTVIRKLMACWAWVQTSFDASSAPGCCPQSHEILLNKGMKYWDSGLNARGLRTFRATAHIAAVAVIGWMRLVKERTGQTQLSTKFARKLSFMPCWNPADLFFLFFEISSLMWPNRGFEFYAPLKPSVLFPPVFWNLRPCVTIPEGPGAIFSSLYATSQTAWTTSQYAQTTRQND